MAGRVSTRRVIAGPAGELSFLEWPASGDAGLLPVVFLHPVNTAAAIWDDVAQLLGDDRAAYAIDYRGHGGSAPGGPYLPADYADDAFAMMDAADIRRAHLVGGSIGGAVSVELAVMARSRVASIALFGATVRLGFPPEALAEMVMGLRIHGVRDWFAMHGSDIVGSASVPGVAGRLVELASADREVETVIEIILATFGRADSRPAADALHRAVPPPALVATGTEDPTCPPEMAGELARFLGTEAILLGGIGHLPMIEAPLATAALIKELLVARSA
jgi:3-oxoadipate enol-lactonase